MVPQRQSRHLPLPREQIVGLEGFMLPITRVEIPEISNRRLGYLVRIIRPVISLISLPMGRWPQDEVRTFFLSLPKDLRGENFLNQGRIPRKPVRLAKEAEIRTLHTPGSAGRVFHPTIAEVLAQIPECYYGKNCLPANRIVAFETFLEDAIPGYEESGGFHVARTVLLVPASPDSGEFMRYQYT